MTDKLPLDEFSLRHIPKYRLSILKDNVTGVEYIISVVADNHCVTPRLNSDGSLYCEPNLPTEACK